MEPEIEGQGPDTEEVQSEFFIDRTEYHKIMAEALAEAPARVANDGTDDPLVFVAPPEKREAQRRQTFYVGAAIIAVILLFIGGTLFLFSS